MTSSNNCGSRPICASAHVAKFCRSSESAGNNWGSACFLYGYRCKIPCRIRHFDDSGIHIIHPASRAQLLPLMSRLPIVPCHFLQHGRGPRSMRVCHFVDDPPNSPFPQKRRSKFSIPFNEIGLCCAFSPFSM
ncbi:hypothetical protein AVEN_50715-1 [Araneus ventricosus]|uniref:Uncharacterized protein n=1 Tax=Araneus ventricosus TaxID=182803 RepID=A0A4Y2HY34_ARAVE|nr:hypothetical protein AVEN_50715-1 [Araneus ventricosus]